MEPPHHRSVAAQGTPLAQLVAGARALPPWVQSKDIILELLRRYGVRGGRGKIFEFWGDGVATLSVTERGTICNMITETGATGAVFPSDERVREWLVVQDRGDHFVPLHADPQASYDAHEVIDLQTT